ncbi:MAG TPA: 2-polyprenyl-3-methyl-6-methoxy-1,4-benzoquinone monooxygenase [Candidatus Desulfobacillus sp.]|nr:2-polyprenyl-3-methyl-6-methoxy-1,4-benzoquinone monooxygenase [Candidatus Desulfobacillus sp.]
MMDGWIIEFDRALRAVLAPARGVRAMPGESLAELPLAPQEKRHAAALMRVNHCGEICAQALYQGQALASRDESLKKALRRAAEEESDHLAWTERRLAELGGRKSALNPIWYAGSLFLGVLAGRLGAGLNLGFLAETERQVERHLEGHLQRLPGNDAKSRAVIEQMRREEAGHAATAEGLGARPLPLPAKLAMKLAARLMTTTSYRL